MVSFKGLATLLFGKIVDRYASIFSTVKKNIPKADIKVPFRTYVSTAIFISIIVYFISLFFFLTILHIFNYSLILMMAFSFSVSAIVAVFNFIALIYYPANKVAVRRKNIEKNLPFALMHIRSVAESGINPYAIFKLVSKFEEYGDVAKEMEKIAKGMENLGIDPLTAIRQVANRSPSDELRQFLLGFVTTVESGGDIKTFLKNTAQEALFKWRTHRERFMQQLSVFAEFYVGIVIAAPLFIISLFAVMSIIQPTIAGYSMLALTKLGVYGAIPILNIAFLLFLRGMEVEI